MTANADNKYQMALQFAARKRRLPVTAALKNTYAASVAAVEASTPTAISGLTPKIMSGSPRYRLRLSAVTRHLPLFLSSRGRPGPISAVGTGLRGYDG